MVLRNALEMVNLDVVAIKEYCLFHLYRYLLSDTFSCSPLIMIDHANYTARNFLLFEQCLLFLNLTFTSLLSSLPPVFLFFFKKVAFMNVWFQVERLRGKKNRQTH